MPSFEDTYTEAPDSVRIILIILTILSFAPQLYSLWTKKNSTGISLGYVLANLLVVTEDLTKEVYLTLNVPEAAAGIFTHDPLNTGDWLNFVQVLVTWALFLTLFILCVRLRRQGSDTSPYRNLYILVLLISLVPELIDLLGLTRETKSWPRQDLREMFIFTHAVLLTPMATFIGGFSWFLQAAQSRNHVHDTALSLTGLAIQAVVFGFIAISWVFRVVYAETWDPLGLGWYFEYGYPVVNNAVFAGVQFLSLVWALYWRTVGQRPQTKGKAEREREREPLLEAEGTYTTH
ncbi:hypothetical protein BP00DRAFT_363570 [Aspergillus indologenus CBS 114.80]|uniref:Uncharacterized protein n=1 Tax=Aspergillus indologenus CBS 114.80 TaxID=1450541 RepID=A0A2V5J0A9_9EURO|nr:hypothetical protein BP00DRAFT_363570 [Aspergillus indologenus CBS 114.80]